MFWLMWFLNFLTCIYSLYISRGAFFIFWLIATYITFPILFDYMFATASTDIIWQSMLFAALFNFIFLFVQKFFCLRQKELSIENFSKLNLNGYQQIIFISLVCSLVFLYFSSSGFSGYWLHSWQEIVVGRSGWEDVFYNLANIFLTIAGVSLFGYLILKKHKLLMLVFIFIVFVFSLLLKVKWYVLYLVIPPLMHISWRVKRNTLGNLCCLVITLLSLVFLYYTIKYVRWSQNFNSLSFNRELFDAVVNMPVESDLRPVFYKIMHYFSVNGSLMGDSYTRVFLKPLTFVLGGDAPSNPMYQYAEIVGENSTLIKASNHPTIYGDAFANFGFLGVMLGAFWAGILGVLSDIRRFKSFLVYFSIQMALCFSLPLAMRGSVVYALYFLLIMFVVSVVIVGFFSRIKIKHE